MAKFIVSLKNEIGILVDNVTDVCRHEDFVDFYNKELLVASFNNENLSHFLQVDSETAEAYKNPTFI
ncbi:hypothetical protein ACQKNX_02295 [Lysinibacillus sp. NPDC093712]|uniref:hypothetical protein n=1 Tax=Lysinibacillus sp. NPDC093712 TaxID=3390579 RepID=UPI003CFEDCCF